MRWRRPAALLVRELEGRVGEIKDSKSKRRVSSRATDESSTSPEERGEEGLVGVKDVVDLWYCQFNSIAGGTTEYYGVLLVVPTKCCYEPGILELNGG